MEMETKQGPSLATSDTQRLAFSIKEAARASGLSRAFLYLRIADGVLRARKCGARTVILESDLRAFLGNLPSVPPSARRDVV
jgi:hypothetical protein